MKYKKVIIFLTIVLGAAVFCKVGSLMAKPQGTIAVRREVQAASDRRGPNESEKIAVVNLDEGVQGDEGQVNYAQRLSRFPTTDFEYSSLEAARRGFETGRYGAYIIIPAVFSQNVESINTAPQVSQLEYAVNRSCSKELQYELLYNVQSYIESLNHRLSYMYVDNILKEFHEAQDYADSLMENDIRDKAAIERIGAEDLVVLVQAPDFQAGEDTVKVPDISEYTQRNAMLASSVEEEYTRSVQEIRDETAALYAAGTTLLEWLWRLDAQTPKSDLTVDENGESIIERADVRLRAELERQSEDMLEKEAASQFLRKLLEEIQQFREEWRQINGQPEQPDGQSGEQPDGQPGEQSDEEPEQSEAQEYLSAWLMEEEQEIKDFLEEIKNAKALDTENVMELVRTEYSEPLEARAEEAAQIFKHRQEEELAAVASYNEQLAGFRPQINDQFISQSVNEMTDNNSRMQDALLKNSHAYMEYAQRSADSVREYADGLYKNMDEIRRKSDQAVRDGLKEAQRVKEETSLKNQKILGSFASKLPYTRNGSVENTLVYQFIVNPLTAEDQFEGQKKNNGLLKSEDDVQKQISDRSLDHVLSEISDKKKFSKGILYAAAGTLAVILIMQIYFFIRRRSYEY